MKYPVICGLKCSLKFYVDIALQITGKHHENRRDFNHPQKLLESELSTTLCATDFFNRDIFRTRVLGIKYYIIALSHEHCKELNRLRLPLVMVKHALIVFAAVTTSHACKM